MLLGWLLLTALFNSLANAVVCNADLGTFIRSQDCQFAKAILYTRLILYHQGNPNFVSAHQAFTIDSGGDSRYRMPQGASFGSCGLGIDITPARAASASWAQLLAQVDTLILGCPDNQQTPGRGGVLIIGAFNILVVNPGQGMCILAGTCMAPNPSRNPPLPLLLELAGRYRGFDRITTSNLVQPVTTILPAPPALLNLGFTITSRYWPQYRVGGQWVCNTDFWSPMIMGEALLTTHPRPVFILLTAVRATPGQPSPFSRNFPRPMGAAWFRRQNGNLIQVRGAWGARGPIWYPLTGDLTNVNSFVRIYEWVLVELGDTNQPRGSISPGSRQGLGQAAANQRQTASPQGLPRAGSVAGAQQAADTSAGAVDDDNQSEATIPNSSPIRIPMKHWQIWDYGSQGPGQAAGSMGAQALAIGSSEAGPSRLNPGLDPVSESALNTSTAVTSSAPTLSPQYSTTSESDEAQGDDAGRPFKRPRPDP